MARALCSGGLMRADANGRRVPSRRTACSTKILVRAPALYSAYRRSVLRRPEQVLEDANRLFALLAHTGLSVANDAIGIEHGDEI